MHNKKKLLFFSLMQVWGSEKNPFAIIGEKSIVINVFLINNF